MKSIGILAAVLSLALACQPAQKSAPSGAANPVATADSDPNAEEVSYGITQGQVNWVGKKAVGSQHIGTIDIADGSIVTRGNDVVGGSIFIDMSSIQSTDLDGEMKEKLEGHLRSDDFFSVEGHPRAEFAITGARQISDEPSVTHEVSGDLTIKGIRNPVTMKANISFVGDKVFVATPSFSIDRTKWDVKYGSGLLGTAADKIINDDIFLVVSLDGKQ